MTCEINWEKADQLLTNGCTGTEVAGYFGIHPKTFYRKVEEEKNMTFGEYLQVKRHKGKALLRSQQFAKAMGYTDKGDNSLLIWLGKCHLEQKENHDIIPTNDKDLDIGLDQIKCFDIDSMKKLIQDQDKQIQNLKAMIECN